MVLKIWQTAHPAAPLDVSGRLSLIRCKAFSSSGVLAPPRLPIQLRRVGAPTPKSPGLRSRAVQDTTRVTRRLSPSRVSGPSRDVRERDGGACAPVCSTGPDGRVTRLVSSLLNSRAEAGDFTGGRMGPNGFPSENPPRERPSKKPLTGPLEAVRSSVRAFPGRAP